MEKKIKKIKLPRGQAIRSKLEDKLAEYQGRVGIDAEYKAAIVEELLEKGKVYPSELKIELLGKYEYVDGGAFDNAVGVIADYCKTGGKNVKDGTGF